MNWQPIETAPKDGRTILLGRGPIEDCEAISVPGFWQEGWEDSIDDMGCDSGFVDVHFQEFSGGRSFGAEKYRCAPNQPTHWMPLPAAPAAECRTCSGHGAVGNILTAEPCPDCTPAPAASARQVLTDSQILHLQETHVGGPAPSYPIDAADWLNFGRAVEYAALAALAAKESP